ncbi:hypothetical protein QLQ15_15740 [Lysobacter sp. LF1]|uniref:Beta-barrel assembly machine subunit BamC n=1 Tax=Lysobacter stagni TaxID=3045172 RepID=A0ABT6XJL6_9GAMM|nr:hypothetical protein [Lysobacter sp. LF1]MDI9240360.1 hypothetical protein [Lysobacter sp. LF1]
MRSNVSMTRVLVASVLLAGIALGSGCSWFRKTDKLYSQSPETRPLEVPPDLDLPRTDTAVNVPSQAATNAVASGQASGGFTLPTARDDAFAKVGEALAAVQGVNIANRAQALGVYDVNYEGANFLVRVAGTEQGSYVSAVDPRGLPATGDAPKKLIDALRTALAVQ